MHLITFSILTPCGMRIEVIEGKPKFSTIDNNLEWSLAVLQFQL